MQRTPIDELLPELLSLLEERNALVLQAPPGAGKTTRVPPALLSAPFLQGRSVIMLEPRRLAAVNAARFMAGALGEEVGGTVGYTIRFEKRVSAATRIEVVTEGILARRLQNDPLLEGVGAVIFDEFHERNLTSDLSLALCRDVQKEVRDDLRLIVMSATLDAAPVAALLGEAPLLSSQGRSFPVEVRYLAAESRERIAELAFSGARRALSETSGDVLVFLPGGGEIRRCHRLLHEAFGDSIVVAALYGDLPFAAQQRAILPAEKRKVVLATNIAETSLTIEGVRVVVDTGYSRQLRFDPGTGLNRLEVRRISAASAEQRAGRAGRVAPGVCYRLWTEHTQRTLLPFTPPEIRVSDLAPLALDLALWGVDDPRSLSWLDEPPAAHLEEGRSLLKRLGALDHRGAITKLGREMASLPMHPRLAAMLIASRGARLGAHACTLAAILSERDLLPRGAGQLSESDLLDRVEALARRCDPQASRTVERLALYFRQTLRVPAAEGGPTAAEVGALLMKAYPDRIGKERAPASGRYLLANGTGGRLSTRSNLRAEAFIVAVEVEGGGAEGEIHLASAVSLEEVRRVCTDTVTRERRVFWDPRESRVVAREEERLGALVLSERVLHPSPDEVVAALLEGIRGSGGVSSLPWSEESLEYRRRVAFLAEALPEEKLPELTDEILSENLELWLAPHLHGVRSMAQLGRVDMTGALKGMLDWRQQKLVEEGAPTHLRVPSGSRVQLHYPPHGAPYLAVKLQEMFGLAETPRIASGRVPVLIHLLSPARRPIQVTADLKSFWNGAYQEVKKELKGRYPKHPWPDDPWQAQATAKVKRRM
ncbi:ATP-dependent helicase HrpB [Geomonas sp. RF6]|uniref:ATP-dependent helicase HrpB n=1 Tax=Geomonas sp. RF6 TaxID=2897342 RepID=UPI001E6461DD|nr:ATP-dependent helicase HrpB [Geomonas sp. RF6]UFS69273.1 ATP-dependent helicase HrpB [Geomonas sp. RF6]